MDLAFRKSVPVLQLPGEVIVNFMFDFVNRFLEDPRPEIAETFNPLFGGPNWYSEVESRVRAGEAREDAVLDVYRSRFKKFGNFNHVTSTRILKPLADRSFFHLVYGTRHWKGLVEFRGVERKAIDVQEQVRDEAKITNRVQRTGQEDLFAKTGMKTESRTFESERNNNLQHGLAITRENLSRRGSMKYEAVLSHALELPLVWESDVQKWLQQMRQDRDIEIPELSGKSRTAKFGYTIVRKRSRN